jgi:hypothetical protein
MHKCVRLEFGRISNGVQESQCPAINQVTRIKPHLLQISGCQAACLI